MFACLGFSQDSIRTIAFGSCSNQNENLEIFDRIAEKRPDLFIFLGDNIYADTKNMCKMKKQYKKLGKNPHFNTLRESTTILATWDDHDYGLNDVGKYYPKKEESKALFLDFFEEPKFSSRFTHQGIYTSYFYEQPGKRIQIILLDLRTFRSDLLPYPLNVKKDTNSYQFDYSPHISPDSTILGEEQWAWLEEQLGMPADLRIICSSTQFDAQYNGYETWANFPHEKQKMFALIKKMHAEGVLFLSGDVHYGEISKVEESDLYPIYDVTSSGLTQEWKFATKNKYRIAGPIMENHFGMLTFDWQSAAPTIKMEIYNYKGELVVQQIIAMSSLKFD